MRKRQKGSITVFAVLSLVLVTGCLLALLEGARTYELRRIASLRGQMALEAPFARYNSCLWDNYHLLGNHLDNLQSLIVMSAESGYMEQEVGGNLLMLKLKEVEIDGYTLITDGGGLAYVNAVSAYMENNLLYEVAKGIYNQYGAIKELLENHSGNGREIEDALKGLEEAKKEAEKSGNKAKSKAVKSNTANNPLETVQKLQKTQLLELVIEDTNQLSQTCCDLGECVSGRELQTGINIDVDEADWLDSVYLQQYVLTYLTDYTNQQDGRGLNYELEYLIGGKNNDVENLREVVNRILLIREAANLAYLLSDAEKMEAAYGMALLLAGASANPVIIEVVRGGIIAAWAFGESVLDMRALLANKKVPFIKNRETWTLGIEGIGELGNGYLMAKESEYGVTYQTYLGLLLLFQDTEEIAVRTMDVQEMTLEAQNGCVKLDQLVVRANASIVYEYAPVFFDFPGRMDDAGAYVIHVQKTYGYY